MNMADTVIGFLDAFASVWSGIPSIADTVLKLKGHKSAIDGLAFEQASGVTKGATNLLQVSREAMTGLAVPVIQKLRPFAKVAGKADLLPLIDFSESELTQISHKDGLNRCKVVLEEGRKYQPEMADFGLSVEELDALEAAINGVAMLSGDRDGIIGARKTATQGIQDQIDKIRDQLEILDDLVPALVSDNTFVQTYKNNRRIIDR